MFEQQHGKPFKKWAWDFNRETLRGYKLGIEKNPAYFFESMFKSFDTGTPLSVKARMLNQAPLAALGWGPKSWREAQLAARQRTVLSNEAKKHISRMAVS